MTVWYRNRKTGLCWEVDGLLIDRLSKDPDYEVVSAPHGTPDYATLSYQELRARCKEKGISTYQMTKDELIATLKGVS